MEAIAKQSNFIFSPTSLRAGLALRAAGTHGLTLRQLLMFLGSEDTHHLDAASARLLVDVIAWSQLSFAADIFIDRALLLMMEFVSSATSAHHAVARSVDFRKRPAAALYEVSTFIERPTTGRLRNVLTRYAIGSTTKVVLTNALHFKATWAQRFDSSDTIPRDFFRRDDRPVQVPFLSDTGMQCAESFDDPGVDANLVNTHER
jgi:serpin B